MTLKLIQHKKEKLKLFQNKHAAFTHHADKQGGRAMVCSRAKNSSLPKMCFFLTKPFRKLIYQV